MELSAYLIPLRRWWWLLVASTLVATVSSYFATVNQPPIFRAHTTLMIGRVIENPNPDQGEIYLAQSLAQTYADIAKRDPMRNATMQALEMTWLPEYETRALPQTQLIEIAVTDVNPQRAQVVANELGNQLILRSPTGSRSEDLERQQFITMQLNNLQVQIEETQDEITKLQDQLGSLNSARQIQEVEAQISTFQTKLTTLQGNYAALLANTVQGATNTLTIVETAELPTVPIGPNKNMSIMLSAAIGFSLAAGAAYLLEYLDDTVKTPEEITRILDFPVIGLIGETKKGEDGKNSVYVSKYPRSPIAEAYRGLRTNLEYTGVDRPIKTIMVTSGNIDSGKSSVATNLAVILAHSDKKVILVDADMRKSSIHNYTGLSNKVGLSDLLSWIDGDLSGALKTWDGGKVEVITSGSPPPNPAELIGSQRMENILGVLKEKSDIVIIDSPPLIVSDPLLLAAKVDGVLLVIRPGHTRKKVILAMAEQMKRVDAKILGIVLNRIPQRGGGYYGGYLYNSPYNTYGGYTSEVKYKRVNRLEPVYDWIVDKIRMIRK